MYDNSIMCNNSRMYANSKMYDNSRIKCNEGLFGKLASEVDKFIDISNSNGRIVTGVLKNGEILFNIGCQTEITEEMCIDRIYNDCNVRGKGLEKHPYRKEYLKIIKIIKDYFNEY